MKKVLVILFVWASVVVAQTSTPPAAGDGSQANPYRIATLENLYWLSQTSSAWDKYFEQTADIDASATRNWDNGAGFLPIGSGGWFSGYYNGNGHVIKALYINRNSNSVGLFSYISADRSRIAIEKLGLVSADINGGDNVGGLVGELVIGAISQSYVTGGVKGGIVIGGIVGYMAERRAKISDSYMDGEVTGNKCVGGGSGAGSSSASASRSYATGRVTGNDKVGAFLGCDEGFNATDLYYNSETTGQNVGIGYTCSICTPQTETVTARTTAEMLQQTKFTGFDFDATWVIYEGHSLPLLRAFLKPVTVRPADSTKAFDGLAFSGGQLAYDVDNVDASQVLGTLVFGGTAQGATVVGTYENTLEKNLYSTQQGYLIRYSDVPSVLKIAKAPLTITAQDVSLAWGSALPAQYAFTYKGFVNGDDKSVVTGLTAAPSCGECKDAGDFSIVPSGAVAKNYEISYAPGKLTVMAPVSVLHRQPFQLNLHSVAGWDLLGRNKK